MSNLPRLLADQYYHIFNRGNNGETLFREQRNYPYFLRLYGQYIEPVAETYAYCLLNNHFHFLVRIKDWQSSSPSRAFANLFSTYTKAFNRAYQRTGSLFEKPFKRNLVDSDRYFTCLVAYIHRNPQRHGFVDDFRDWPYSSYKAVLSAQPTRIQRERVLGWFDGRSGFKEAHLMEVSEATIQPLIADDWM
jgi:REP element-mobilizing transposase RayT